MKKGFIILIIFLFGLLTLSYLPEKDRPNQHSIIFYTGQGASTIERLVVESNTFAIKPETPTKRSSTFVDWYKTPNFEDGTEFDFASERVNSNMTLYAKWFVERYIVYVHLLGGTVGEDTDFYKLFTRTESEVADAEIEFNVDSLRVFFNTSSSQSPRHATLGRYSGVRDIHPDDYKALSAEAQLEHPFIRSFYPKDDDFMAYFTYNEIREVFALEVFVYYQRSLN